MSVYLVVDFANIAEIKFEELVALNHDMNPDILVEGQTILLPGGKLSSRDREILAGIGPATYRTYPVREGEVLQDIMEKRNITRAEMEALNPGISLDRLSSKLSAGCLLLKSCLPHSAYGPAIQGFHVACRGSSPQAACWQVHSEREGDDDWQWCAS